MANGIIDELRKGNWMELPRADGLLGYSIRLMRNLGNHKRYGLPFHHTLDTF